MKWLSIFRFRRGFVWALVFLGWGTAHVFAIGQLRYVENVGRPGSFPVFAAGTAATLLVSSNDHAGVIRAARDLGHDIARVTGRHPGEGFSSNTIIIGTLGRSELVDGLADEHKIEAGRIAGKWESFLIQVVPGVGLVIAGSDKRGTIYGIYDFSEQIGVSPWYWWADVAAEHKDALYVKAGTYVQGPPAVKYRGIFLNDEAPDLTRWVAEKYGTIAVPGVEPPANYGRGFYTNLFELILRLKGNYLWPAMWNNRFNEDDPECPRLADEYGIVMGTSHQEPMLRAQKEWDWGTNYGRKHGNWNYAKTEQQPVLQEFWREGVRRNKNYESIYTMGLRSENDSGKPVGKELTQKIVDIQRKILAEEVNPDVTQVPQLWCLYSEVLDYYNKGMTVPDDVTLLWCDDNWGDIRRLPTREERGRPGGAGIYYHFDYHGGPRSYQWINASPLPKTWEQMSLAYQSGADRIWIVNVGHFKGYELPTEFFLNMAWEPLRWTGENLDQFLRLWAEREFGPAHAEEIADIVAKTTKYNGRRKPELLAPDTYSLDHYDEAERVLAEFKAVNDSAERIYKTLPPERKDAFYELVLFPAKAAQQLNELYIAAGKNARYAREGRASANDMAARVHELFQAHTNLMNYFNKTFLHGKWDHFMDQPVLGYTNWRDPSGDSLRAIALTNIPVPDSARMGIAPAGGDALPQFDVFNRQTNYIGIFDGGKTPCQFTAVASAPWIVLSDTNGTVEKDRRLWVHIDWSKAPRELAEGAVRISSVNTNFTVAVQAFNPTEVTRDTLHGFVEGEGVVSIEPEHFTGKTESSGSRWTRIEDYGRTLSGMRADGSGGNSTCLNYDMYVFHPGAAKVITVLSPTLNFIPGRGLRFAVSLDDQPRQTVTLVPADYSAHNHNRDWEATVKDNARFATNNFSLEKPGYHRLKIWMVDPGVVVQKIVVDLGGLKSSCLGPPESFYNLPSAATQDWQRSMQSVNAAPSGSLPPPADDPQRPAGTRPVPGSAYNWTDGVPGHTIVRSTWGNWSNYKEEKADRGELPDPLRLKNGQPVKDADTWWKLRRPEILNDFESEIYGRTPTNTPEIAWEIAAVDTNAADGRARMKTITGHVDNARYPNADPGIRITLYTPLNATGPVPVMVSIPGPFHFRGRVFGEPGPRNQVLAQGWGYATVNTGAIQADSGAGLTSGIIGLMNQGQPRKPDDWGVLAAWGWGLSRAIDYFELDKDVDAKHLGIEGHSRWGKTALLAAALDPRWAIVYSSCSGEGGAKLHRHDIGESVDNVAGPGEYHWMAENFLKYAGYWNDLPVDQHELIALVAPRPVFITGGTRDLWSDPTGEFKACVAAGPVYRLLGKKDLGTTELPAPDHGLMDGDLAFRWHEGGHTDAPDWPIFLTFAKRFFGPGPK